MRREITAYLSFFLCLFFLTISQANATRVRQLNLEELIDRAGRIVVGTCRRVEVVSEPGFGLVTRVTLRVDRSLKGTSSGEVTLKLAGAQDSLDGRTRIIGLPGFRQGEEMVLFLYPESSAGFSSPVGFGQGKFLKTLERNGKVGIRNAQGNRGLFRGLSDSGSRKLAPWTDGDEQTPSEAIGFEALQQMIVELRGAGR